MSENKYCGNCKHFKYEDVEGKGICSHPIDGGVFAVGCWVKACRVWEPRGNGWTEITPDNVGELCRKDHNRIIIGWLGSQKSTFVTTFDRCAFTPEDMAKYGGYYYYVLPELKEEE